MEEEELIKIGITLGDLNGVGGEVIIKAFAEPTLADLCIPVLYASEALMEQYATTLGIEPLDFHVITNADDAISGFVNLINCIRDDYKFEPGKPSPTAGKVALQSLDAAVADLRRGAIDTLLTAPVNKHNMQSDAFQFAGHTEYLEHHFGDDGENGALMIMAHDQLRIAMATGHIPLREVAQRLSVDRVLNKLKRFDHALQQDFNIGKPRIAVLSLNPHAGDKGLLGEEEQHIIQPAMRMAEEAGILVFGPYPADGFFGSGMCFRFDGTLAMYHDQGMIPFKTLAMDSGVNFTAGLPVVRTSPAHGTAYDIAGRNQASPDSFRQALYLALDVYRNRQTHAAATANPLRKQYVDRGSDNVKLDLTKDEPNE